MSEKLAMKAEEYCSMGGADQWQSGEYFFDSRSDHSQEERRPCSKPIVLRHIADIVAEQREPQWLIHKVIEKKVLAVVAGKRGTFKSFIVLDWAMRMAIAGHPGVILSGEGGGLDRRIAAWMNEHRDSTDVATIPLVALERPLNLTVDAVLEELTIAIRALDRPPEFIIIDTLSKFSCGLDENSNPAVAAFLSKLSLWLRENLGCTVILVLHMGHGDGTRPRGASALMANPDCEYIVDRPDPAKMTVTVTRERFKDSPSLPALAYEAKLVDLGRLDSYGEPVTSLALVSTDAPLPTPKGRGANQEKVSTALKEWHRNHPDAEHVSTDDLTKMCKAQRIWRNRQNEVRDAFVNAKIFTHAVGGYIVDWKIL
jgi:hypothetical protein